MKKLLSLTLALLLIITAFAACGGKKSLNRKNYTGGTADYVELCSLDELTIDLNSEEFKKIVSNLYSNDLQNNPIQFNEGTLQKGDIANIDYAGSVDGVAFTGGTAKAQELELGSGSFIDGFEDQLIGKKVGETVNVNVTFPAGYDDTTDLETGKTTIVLSNTPAVFVVKINSFKRAAEVADSALALKLGFSSLEDYNNEVLKQAKINSLLTYIDNNSKIISYPGDKYGNTFEYHKKDYTSYAAQYGATFQDLLSSYNLTEEDFKKEVTKADLICYACFDALGLKLADNAIQTKIDELAKKYQVTAEEIKEHYGENYIEAWVVSDMVTDALLDKAEYIGE